MSVPRRVTAADARTANLLGALSLTVTDAMMDAVASVGRGGATPTALVLLHDEPGMSVTELGTATGLTQPGATRLVDALEAEGLVVRGPGRDGRTHALRLSAAGQRRVRSLLARRDEMLDALLSPLTTTERRQLEGLLDRLLRSWVRDEPHAIEVCRLCDATVCPVDRCPVELAPTLAG